MNRTSTASSTTEAAEYVMTAQIKTTICANTFQALGGVDGLERRS
ncbi:hypothetical protein P6166_02365 [Stenotrophomonas sp. HITSZ_GD]|nr:hypothetical protein [Stenotrophomonas sp. HITSZ_GD]MDG2524202.1 hypothetical protein [Stenotrophomonas sp. HITSZ_GD]